MTKCQGRGAIRWVYHKDGRIQRHRIKHLKKWNAAHRRMPKKWKGRTFYATKEQYKQAKTKKEEALPPEDAVTLWMMGAYDAKGKGHNIDSIEIIADNEAEARALMREHGFKGLQDQPLTSAKRYLKPGQKKPKKQIRVKRHRNSNWYHPPTLAELALEKSKREYISTPTGDRKYVDLDWYK